MVQDPASWSVEVWAATFGMALGARTHHLADSDTRAQAHSLIRRARARGIDVLIAAAGSDAGALALAAIRHALHLKGLA